MRHSTRQHVYSLVSRELCAQGGRSLGHPGPTCLATFEYDTIVGKKQAHIVDFWPSDAEQLTLTGEYQSEGRNVLSNVFATLSLQATPEEVKQRVADFMKHVSAAVDASYARRLLLRA